MKQVGIITIQKCDNFGATVVDAMAHGKPVITSTKTPWKIVAGNNCGWWIDDSVDALTDVLRSAIEQSLNPNNRTILHAMGNRGRKIGGGALHLVGGL